MKMAPAILMRPRSRKVRSRAGQRHRKHERSPRLLRRSVSSETGKARVENDAWRAPYQDPFVAEDARTVAKLKNICRGC